VFAEQTDFADDHAAIHRFAHVAAMMPAIRATANTSPFGWPSF
jgi:hypothetical protein